MKLKNSAAAFLSLGFRPFFLLTLLCSFFPIAYWALHIAGKHEIASAPFLPSQWHANEMIFGFAQSALIGFLLTASSKWTSTRGVNGKALAAAAILFLINRAVMWTLPFSSALPYQVLGILIPAGLALHLTVLFVRKDALKQLIVAIPIMVLIPAQYLILSENYTMGQGLALGAFRFLIVVIAGRVIPFFTKTALKLEVKGQNPIFEKCLLGVMFALIFEPLYSSAPSQGRTLWLFLTATALLLNIRRLFIWYFLESRNTPILFVLYLASSWLPLHFALSLLHALNGAYDLGQSALHALTYGALGLMILGITQRVSLGHTGRPIHASVKMKCAYALLFAGTVSRVFGPLSFPGFYVYWIDFAGLAWLISFMLAAWELIPILLAPRIDGKAY
jgi:uncharacterized protein involved in response to NO